MIKKGDTIPGICTCILGIWVMQHVLRNPKMIVLGDAKSGGIGAGFVPFVCAAALIICGLLLAIRGFTQNGQVDYFKMTPEKKKNLASVGCLVGLIIVLMLAWKISKKFILCLPVYIFAVNMLFKRSVKFSIIFTVVVTAFVYFLFCICFSVGFRP